MQNEFVMFVGPMACGKSSSLLAYVDRAKYQKRKVTAFKPIIDDRYNLTSIVSHGGWKIEALPVNNGNMIMNKVIRDDLNDHRSEIIVIDEAFMIPGVAIAAIDLYRQGRTVIISSLDLSYKCEPFVEIMKMMPWATKIEKLSAVCLVCGQDAHYTYKKIWGDNEIDVGGLDIYESRCFLHHPCASVLPGTK